MDMNTDGLFPGRSRLRCIMGHIYLVHFYVLFRTLNSLFQFAGGYHYQDFLQVHNKADQLYKSAFLDTIHDVYSLVEGKLNLSHVFRGFSPWLYGFKAGALRQKDIVEHRWYAHDSQEAEQGDSDREEGAEDQT